MALDPDQALPGVVVVVAPHMDDELIGCGGILASLADGSRAHVVYATDGSRSPSPAIPWKQVDREAIARQRRVEACSGLEALGIPAKNAHFLDLPDGGLSSSRARLEAMLAEAFAGIGPDIVLVPFRFDHHPDHVAVHRAARHLLATGEHAFRLLEYFVYTQWKLLRGRDIRTRIRREFMLDFEPGSKARSRKLEALERHRTQSSRFFSWQTRPNLTPEFLDRVCSETEHLLDPSLAQGGPFVGSTLWIRTAHVIEPRMKRGKDLLLSLVRRRP